ncbi:2-octaprenylphenol hydroxylase [Candidatus Fokinia solitaria]|uniref:2-octaprenylphenol hydroxylase n=1 Tax=Candidatus Fokinia solitaria TaxID=1802984 RepID=A0A2U8BRE5_9RICK|nr:FAD-dependent monooxygenase [Candidatus Fokinia solitaria]AWD32911.1 2-octaprenylphenol hydroxylase [Candidatus Fokinia solitaria]
MLNKYDVAIIGGGVTGMTLAHTLAHNDMHVILVIDNADCTLQQTQIKHEKRNDRAFALSHNVISFLLKNKLLDECDISKEKRIDDILVIDEDEKELVSISKADNAGNSIGYMISESKLRTTIADKLKTTLHNVELLFVTSIDELHVDEGEVLIHCTSDGKKIECKAKLLVAADGKDSFVRKYFNIASYERSYMQTAMCFNINHPYSIKNTAIEKFSANSTIALLPYSSPYESSVVLILKNQSAEKISTISNSALEKILTLELRNLCGNVEITSEIQSYQLMEKRMQKLYHTRTAFVGDAGHVIHPLAGLGLNLGLHDVISLSELILRYNSVQIDIGAMTLLEQYHCDRKLQINSVSLMTNAMHYIGVQSNSKFIRNMIKIGMNAFNCMNPLKRKIMQNI